MAHPVVLSEAAILDIDKAFDYYNSRSYGLGFEFTDLLDNYFKKIGRLTYPLLSVMITSASSLSAYRFLRDLCVLAGLPATPLSNFSPDLPTPLLSPGSLPLTML